VGGGQAVDANSAEAGITIDREWWYLVQECAVTSLRPKLSHSEGTVHAGAADTCCDVTYLDDGEATATIRHNVFNSTAN
jgi:hypothetical protein